MQDTSYHTVPSYYDLQKKNNIDKAILIMEWDQLTQ